MLTIRSVDPLYHGWRFQSVKARVIGAVPRAYRGAASLQIMFID